MCEREIDEPFFLAGACRPGEAGDADRDVGAAAIEGAFSHRPRDDFRDRVVLLENGRLDAEQLVFDSFE